MSQLRINLYVVLTLLHGSGAKAIGFLKPHF